MHITTATIRHRVRPPNPSHPTGVPSWPTAPAPTERSVHQGAVACPSYQEAVSTHRDSRPRARGRSARPRRRRTRRRRAGAASTACARAATSGGRCPGAVMRRRSPRRLHGDVDRDRDDHHERAAVSRWVERRGWQLTGAHQTWIDGHGEDGDAGLLQAALQLSCEEDVRELAAA